MGQTCTHTLLCVIVTAVIETLFQSLTLAADINYGQCGNETVDSSQIICYDLEEETCKCEVPTHRMTLVLVTCAGGRCKTNDGPGMFSWEWETYSAWTHVSRITTDEIYNKTKMTFELGRHYTVKLKRMGGLINIMPTPPPGHIPGQSMMTVPPIRGNPSGGVKPISKPALIAMIDLDFREREKPPNTSSEATQSFRYTSSASSTLTPITTSRTPITTSTTPITTSTTPITTSTAPITTSTTPITTSTTPITTSITPITTSRTPITTSRTPITTSRTPITTSTTPITTSTTPITTSRTPITTSTTPITIEISESPSRNHTSTVISQHAIEKEVNEIHKTVHTLEMLSEDEAITIVERIEQVSSKIVSEQEIEELLHVARKTVKLFLESRKVYNDNRKLKDFVTRIMDVSGSMLPAESENIDLAQVALDIVGTSASLILVSLANDSKNTNVSRETGLSLTILRTKLADLAVFNIPANNNGKALKLSKDKFNVEISDNILHPSNGKKITGLKMAKFRQNILQKADKKTKINGGLLYIDLVHEDGSIVTSSTEAPGNANISFFIPREGNFKEEETKLSDVRSTKAGHMTVDVTRQDTTIMTSIHLSRAAKLTTFAPSLRVYMRKNMQKIFFHNDSNFQHISSEQLRNGTVFFNYPVTRGKWTISILAESDNATSLSVRTHQVYCRFWSLERNRWEGDGCRVGDKTDLNRTQCICNHLSHFTSGLLTMPNRLDFEEDIALFLTFIDNPTVVAMEIAMWFIYLLVFLLSWKKDRVEEKKWKETIPLPIKYSPYLCTYEVEIYTGLKPNAGTTAQVSLMLIGEDADSGASILSHDQEEVFYRANVSRFIVWSKFSLGDIKKLLLWHDGGGSNPDWFVSRVVVTDQSENKRFYFLCNQWLIRWNSAVPNNKPGAAEFGIYNVLTACELQKYSYLFNTKTHAALRDTHLTINVFKRGFLEGFGRAEKVTVFFIGLQFLMFSSLLFYGVPEESEMSHVDVGVFRFNGQQIGVMLKSLVVSFGFTIIYGFLFGDVKPKQLIHDADNYTTAVPMPDISIEMKDTATSCGSLSEPRQRLGSIVKLADVKSAIDRIAKDHSMTRNMERRKTLSTLENTDLRDFNEADKMMALVLKDSVFDRQKKGQQQDIPNTKQKESLMSRLKIILDGLVDDEEAEPVLPPWFIWIVYGMALITCLLLTFLSMMYGLKFGKQTSFDWLMSVIEGIIGEMLIEDPLKLFVAIVIFVLITNKSDTLAHLSHVYELERHLTTVERKTDTIKHPDTFVKHQQKAVFIDTQKLTMVKHDMVVWEVFPYICPIFLLFCSVYISNDLHSSSDFDLIHRTKELLEGQASPNTGGIPQSYYSVKSYSEFWLWFTDTFYPSLAITLKHDTTLPIVNSFGSSSILAGPLQLRQLRMSPNLCEVTSNVGNIEIPVKCSGRYSIKHELHDNFFLGWKEMPKHQPNLKEADRERNGWNYFSTQELEGNLYYTDTNTYSGGGYIAELNPPHIAEDVDDLQRNGWLDNNTKALFLDFCIYSANAQLFIQSKVLFADNSVGGIEAEYQISLARTSRRYRGGMAVVSAILEVLFSVLSITYMYFESKRIIFYGKHYLYSVWNVLNLAVIVIMLFSIGTYAQLLFVRFDFEYTLNTHNIPNLQELTQKATACREIIGLLICLLGIQIVKLCTSIKLLSFVATALDDMLHVVAVPLFAIFTFFLASTAALHYYFISFHGAHLNRPDTSILTLLRSITRSSSHHTSTGVNEHSLLLNRTLLLFTAVSFLVLIVYSKIVLLYSLRQKRNTTIIMKYIKTRKLPFRLKNMLLDKKDKKKNE